ncbi:MAG: type II toxin-antitoxin system RelE/ParE family toxin [Clostridia bacterium]|nr:type II toxin-antitoxin system RelE/ParE family toxin [Clostridia bacterium]
MVSKVLMTRLAQSQLSHYVSYIRHKFKNAQAAKAVTNDARETRAALLQAADTLGYCKDPDLRALGYRIIYFRRHRYLFVYSVHDDVAIIEATYHELQDYENTFKGEVLGL